MHLYGACCTVRAMRLPFPVQPVMLRMQQPWRKLWRNSDAKALLPKLLLIEPRDVGWICCHFPRILVGSNATLLAAKFPQTTPAQEFQKLEQSYSSLKIKKVNQTLSDWFLELKTNVNDILQSIKKLKSEEELEKLKVEI